MGRRGGGVGSIRLLRVVKSDPEFMAPVNFYAGIKGAGRCIFYDMSGTGDRKLQSQGNEEVKLKTRPPRYQ